MIILAIETSCDDTCVAVLEIRNWKLEILSNVVSSQAKIHSKYGGVYPSLAKREHQRNLPLVLKKALRQAGFANPKFQIPNIDFIGVTVGPGLEPCLWQGVNFAKTLSATLKKPLIPINHLEAHILGNFLSFGEEIKNEKLKIKNLLPAMCLIVSGGHTQLILMKDIGKYKLIGETRDDAAGECFDKTARILGLGYPGGPAIAANAAKNQNAKIKNQNAKSKCKINLPKPMIYQKNYDFSFSGLKTAVLYKVKSEKQKAKSEKFIKTMCAEIQQAIIDVLIHKTLKAAKNFRAKSIILGGGVAANEELRQQFKLEIENCKLKINFLVPPKKLCTDNAAMVAAVVYFHQLKKKIKKWKKIEVNANLRLE